MQRKRPSLARYGKWALITGASSGIGKQLARLCCEDGLCCILLAEKEQELEQAARELREQFEVEIRTCVCDLSRHDHLGIVRDAVEGIEVDVLINCASFGTLGRFLDTPLKTYRDGIGVSVTSYVTLTYELLRGMRARDRGAVVFVSSVNAFAPVAFSAVYSAEKAFELSLGEALWQELRYAGSRVDVLTICASATRTNFQARAGTKTARWAWSPERAARVGLRSLGKRPVVALSWRGNVFRYLSKLLPERLRLRFASWAITSTLAPDRKALIREDPPEGGR
jgi:short-subunit dehydrogenase